MRRNHDVPMVCLATAHPAKFDEAITKANLENPTLPHHMSDLFEREERFDVLQDNIETVQQYIKTNIR